MSKIYYEIEDDFVEFIDSDAKVIIQGEHDYLITWIDDNEMVCYEYGEGQYDTEKY